jgi:hypothetical protein
MRRRSDGERKRTMMTRLANDPVFWGMVSAILGLILAYAKAKTAEIETKAQSNQVQQLAAGQGAQQSTLNQHSAQIAALQATVSTAGPAPASAPQAQAPAAAAPMPVPPIQTLPSAGTTSAGTLVLPTASPASGAAPAASGQAAESPSGRAPVPPVP